MRATPPDIAPDYFLPDLCNGQAVLWLVLGAALLALVLTLARHGLAGFQWADFALLLLLVEWSTLLAAAVLCRLRRWLAGHSLAVGAAACLAVAAGATAAVSLAGHALLAIGWQAGWHPPWEAVASHALIAALLAGMLLRYFFLTYQLRQREQVALSAQVEALTARIRPHFLFNSLNSIASLVAEDARAAEEAVEDLAALFRSSLAGSGTVTAAEERALCERYLRIEHLRLGPRLTVVWQWELAEDTPIPALALQPLLENAVYHGIQKMAAGGRVTIHGRQDRDWVEITVANPCPEAVTHSSGHRVATDNIRRRTQALFGVDAELRLVREPNRFLACLRYRPVRGLQG